MKINDIVIYNNKKWTINSIIKNKNQPHQIKNFGGFIQVVCNIKRENIMFELKSLKGNIFCSNVHAEDCILYLPEFS